MSNLSAEDVGRLRELYAAASNADEWAHPDMECVLRHEIGEANAALAIAMYEALPALLQLAEAVMRAPVGTIEACEFGDFIRPAWVVVDDRQTVALNEPKRVRLVPDGGEMSDGD